jgi:hypothetical protein
LWDRLAAEGRIVDDDRLESNVTFLRSYGQVVEDWRACVAATYEPEALFSRFEHQTKATYAHRLSPPRKAVWAEIRQGLAILARVIWTCGVLASYRRRFWAFAWPRLKALDIERVIAVGIVAHHLISFAREASAGLQNASFYSRKVTTRQALPAAPGVPARANAA